MILVESFYMLSEKNHFPKKQYGFLRDWTDRLTHSEEKILDELLLPNISCCV